MAADPDQVANAGTASFACGGRADVDYPTDFPLAAVIPTQAGRDDLARSSVNAKTMM